MKRLRVGAIGVGRLGFQHAENVAYRIPNAELVAVCDINEEHAKNVAKQLGAADYYSDYKEMLKNPEIDAVLITNTSSEHCECIKAACAAKKHIYCEKPTGLTIEELDEIDKAVAANPGKTIQVGFMRRFDCSYQDAKQRVERGEIGKIIKLRSITRDPACQREDYVRFGPGAGGMFFDMSVHDFDLVRWFAGAEVKSMYAIGGIYEFTEFEAFHDIDNCSVLMQFENGVMAEVEGSKQGVCGYDVWMEVVGTKGTLMINPGTTSFVTQKDEYGMRNQCQPWFRERFKEAYLREMEAFVDAALEERPSAVDTTDARKVVEMAFMAQSSYDNGKIVDSE
jgi:myo-inositol 2-dehydrogenase/D-chiro-inositol 1-dehydrogenase